MEVASLPNTPPLVFKMSIRNLQNHFTQRALGLLAALCLLFFAGCTPSPDDTSADLPQIRLVFNPSGIQGLIPAIIESHDLDTRHGFELVPITSAGSRGANFIAVKTGQADLMTTNWIDTAINRRGGVDIKVIQPFLKWTNVFLAPADSDLIDLSQCRGLRIGITNQNSLDWTVARLATQRLYGFDISGENEITVASSGLLSGLIEQGNLDLILQYSEPAARMTQAGAYKAVTEVADLMAAAKLAPDAPLTCYVMTDDLLQRTPQAAEMFRAAYQDAVKLVTTDTTVDTLISEQFEITDPEQIALTRVRIAKSVFSETPARLPEACQALFEDFKSVLPTDQLGLDTLPEGLFQFE